MSYNPKSASLPPQMLPYKKKDQKWKEDCMDALESIGRRQYHDNVNLIENYEMVKGRFIYSHYLDREEYADLVNELTKEFDIPSHLRHYDIISPVINTLSGEYQKRPDNFKVRAHDEESQNNFLRKKTELLLQYAMTEINNHISERLQAEGLDPDRQDFSSEEEAQAYQQMIQDRTQAMTPQEIELYMTTRWMDQAEIWAENVLQYDRSRFRLHELEKTEFEDMLIADRCFRHFYLSADDYRVETWNPINTFYHKSPEVRYVENGDYVGRKFYMSQSEIVNRFGHLMTEKEIASLEELKLKSYKSGKKGTSWENYNVTPGTLGPGGNYPERDYVSQHLGYDPSENPDPSANSRIAKALGDSSDPNIDRHALYEVTEAYWMSQRRIGKLVVADPETGEPIVMLVGEETFDKKLFPDIIEMNSSFYEFGDDEMVGTITWTWVNQVWKGIKINNQQVRDKSKGLYIDVKPADFQFKGDLNIYGCKLPVCGQVFNARNAESASLVDLMKPNQIGHNVSMNQLYEIQQREIGRFVLMDPNYFPSGEDWGKESYEKWMLIAKQLGIAPVDTSASNVGSANFQHFQQVDLDESARMMSRANIAVFFEQQALKQVGITPQRLGSVAASESATGVQQAVNQSYAQTESYFTNYSNFKTRCMQMNLEIAQFVHSKKDNVSFNYTKSDMSRGFVKINGTDLLTSEFGVFVVNSQELNRQLEMIRQLALENNTMGASPADLATIIMSNSPTEIKRQLEATWEKTQAQQQQQAQAEQQAQQAALEQAKQLEQQKQDFEAEQNELDRANQRYIAEVKAMGFDQTDRDVNDNQIPDVLEVQKFNAQLGKDSEDILFRREQEANKQAEGARKAQLEREKINLKKKEMESKEKQAEEDRKLKREELKSKERIAKQNKNKYDKK